MVRAFTFLRLLVSNNPGFENVISSLNELVFRKNENMMFISIFAGVLNLRTGVLRYVNAGHNPPFASLGGDAFRLLDNANSPPVGITEEMPFPIKELQIQPGDTLLLYTDGIPEALNNADVMYEITRMEQLFNQQTFPSMQALIQTLEEDAESFVGDRSQYDDFTAFAIRFLSPMA
jgi:sigma-B regulation protein RsbU (phosphoserine phosphatase)